MLSHQLASSAMVSVHEFPIDINYQMSSTRSRILSNTLAPLNHSYYVITPYILDIIDYNYRSC
jgi:hypothetical protein